MGRRISCFALALFMAFGAVMYAQEGKEEKKGAQAAEEKGWVTKIFPIKHRDVNSLAALLGTFGAQLRPSPDFHAIAVTGRPEIVEAVGDAIQRFDVPAPPLKNVELTFYIMAAMPEASQPSSIPPELEGVTKQLKSLFSYQSFRVLDTMILRCRDGEQGQATGAGPPPSGAVESRQPAVYQVRFNKLTITPDNKSYVIRMDGLRLGARVPVPTGPNNWQVVDAGFTTDIDVREAQKVVVGKANIDSSNNAMIVVVQAKVVD